jgi:hypothetical protein
LALTCRIGQLQIFDAFAFVRAKIGDPNPPTFPGPGLPFISDAALQAYVDTAAKEFSRWIPLGNITVGNIAGSSGSPPSSPLNTIAFQNRYICNAVNGFSFPVKEITDVLYRASGVFTAASEIAYLALMPVSPLNWFRIDKDLLNSPTSRHIRDQYLQELDHYGIGYWGWGRDAATGNIFIEIFPPPVTSGLPIFVRYTTYYLQVPDGQGNPTYPTIPEDKTMEFARFLLAEVLDQEAINIYKFSQLRSGIIQQSSSPMDIRRNAEQIREDTRLALGASTSMAVVSW